MILTGFLSLNQISFKRLFCSHTRTNITVRNSGMKMKTVMMVIMVILNGDDYLRHNFKNLDGSFWDVVLLAYEPLGSRRHLLKKL